MSFSPESADFNKNYFRKGFIANSFVTSINNAEFAVICIIIHFALLFPFAMMTLIWRGHTNLIIARISEERFDPVFFLKLTVKMFDDFTNIRMARNDD